MRAIFLILAAAGLLTGCADIEVQPATSGSDRIKFVYIQQNPSADQQAPDLESAIENGFQRHGIGTKPIDGPPPSDNDYYVTYTATGGWDLKPFLKAADVRLKRGFKQVGYAHFQAGGGLSVTKFAATRDKMVPVMDQLLAGFH